MKRFKKVVVLVLCLVSALSLVVQAAEEVITLEVAVEQPEYEAQCIAIWDIFLGTTCISCKDCRRRPA